MLRNFFRIAAFGIIGAAACASSVAADDPKATLLAANDHLQMATRSYDSASIRKLITDDFTLITSSARVIDAHEMISEVDDRSITWYANDTEQPNVRVYNGDSAVITAVLHQRFSYQGKLHDYRVRFTDTWVKLGDDWRYVAGHASLLKPT